MFPRSPEDRWIDALSDEDVAFLRRFLLASGSLKDVAAAYGVSYPTIRVRLDRLIEKVRLLDRHREADHFGRTVLTLYADGKIDASAMKALMTAHEQDLAAKADVPKTMGTPKAPFSPG
jgi:hypothetical protein